MLRSYSVFLQKNKRWFYSLIYSEKLFKYIL